VMRHFSYCNRCCKYIFQYKTKYELYTEAHYLITQFYSLMTKGKTIPSIPFLLAAILTNFYIIPIKRKIL
jgi:hypothetical protein